MNELCAANTDSHVILAGAELVMTNGEVSVTCDLQSGLTPCRELCNKAPYNTYGHHSSTHKAVAFSPYKDTKITHMN